MDKACIVTISGAKYIDHSYYLQMLSDRAKLIAEKTAEPGLDQLTTERLRGQRLEICSQLKQLTEA